MFIIYNHTRVVDLKLFERSILGGLVPRAAKFVRLHVLLWTAADVARAFKCTLILSSQNGP